MRIALVDDAAVSRALFTRIATALDHEVVAVVDAVPSDLPRLIREIEPDLVVLDGRLGEPLGVAADGPARLTALVAELHHALPHAAVAIIAALGESALASAIVTEGRVFVIPRPFVRTGVVATLAAVARGAMERA